MSDVGEPGDAAHVRAVAAAFRAAGELFTSLGNAKQTRRVIDALQAEDPAPLRKLFDGVPPFAGRCLALCGAVRVIVEGEELRPMKVCTLKPDLTLSQRLLAKRIFEKHLGKGPQVVVESSSGLQEVVTSTVVDQIYPSPLQDELDANGLVNCSTQMVSVPTWSLGPPTWQCADLCI